MILLVIKKYTKGAQVSENRPARPWDLFNKNIGRVELVTHRISFLSNFIDEEDCSLAISIIKEYEEKGILEKFKDNPDVLVTPLTGSVVRLIKKYSDKVLEYHKELNGFKSDLYTTEGFLSLWNPGAYAGLHIDSHYGYDFLQFASVFYFNEDYSGGEIYFPNQDVSYKPKKADAVIFPCGGSEYVHGVNKVISGQRYTIAMWHSSRIDKASSLFHPDLIENINKEYY
ncbi:hypothetical protein EB001_08545 [bacterium]|nr:hypothetical protein [bacterium]